MVDDGARAGGAAAMSRRDKVERIAAFGQVSLQFVTSMPIGLAEGLPEPVIEAMLDALVAAERLVEVADFEAKLVDEARDPG